MNPDPSKLVLCRARYYEWLSGWFGTEGGELMPRANQKREDVMDMGAGPGSSYLDLTFKKFGFG